VYDIIGKGSQNNDFVQNKTVISYKNSASERNESLLSKCRTQPVLFKNSASEGNESLLSNCRAQPVLLKKHSYFPAGKAFTDRRKISSGPI